MMDATLLGSLGAGSIGPSAAGRDDSRICICSVRWGYELAMVDVCSQVKGQETDLVDGLLLRVRKVLMSRRDKQCWPRELCA